MIEIFYRRAIYAFVPSLQTALKEKPVIYFYF